MSQKRRDFLKNAAAFTSLTFLPSSAWGFLKPDRLRTAHIGVGGMGGEDLKAIASHELVTVTALCDVDAKSLAAAKKRHPGARTYTDYRRMFDEIGNEIDAVVVAQDDPWIDPRGQPAGLGGSLGDGGGIGLCLRGRIHPARL